MPELPEVETVRRGLKHLIVGKQVVDVTVLNEKSLEASEADRRNLIIGSLVVDVRRRAKMLLVDLDNGNTLVVHLKMTGQMVYRGEENWGAGHPNDSFLGNLPDRSTRVIFEFADGRLFFNDQRKFGWIKLMPTVELTDWSSITKLGPEPLEGNPLGEFIINMRRRSRSVAKAAILDQTVIAGVGNIYADESLWIAKIHPETRVYDLTDGDLTDLMNAIQKSMTESLDAGGSTAKNYVQADGSRGDYLEKFAAVYNRTGEPCKRCGHPIEKIRVAGRGTHYCPICQVIK